MDPCLAGLQLGPEAGLALQHRSDALVVEAHRVEMARATRMGSTDPSRIFSGHEPVVRGECVVVGERCLGELARLFHQLADLLGEVLLVGPHGLTS